MGPPVSHALNVSQDLTQKLVVYWRGWCLGGSSSALQVALGGRAQPASDPQGGAPRVCLQSVTCTARWFKVTTSKVTSSAVTAGLSLTDGNSHPPVSSLTVSSRSQHTSCALCSLVARVSLCWAAVPPRPAVLSQVTR